ncbi:MAG TPA: OmpH family outer membrane protein [Sedimentisphaerales bacterium]|nr:OmpH family outer membrane protein [Sedimentisphaerales bacterium]
MKAKSILFFSLLGLAVLFVSYGSWAEPSNTTSDSKYGVVSIRTIFETSQKNVKYRADAEEQQNKMIADLEKLSKEAEADEAGLKTLVAGSSDYIALSKSIFEKQAKVDALKEFYKQSMTMQDKQWTEKIYEDILRITGEVAKQRGLILVLAKDEVEFPSPSANELMLAIRTNKLLYSGGCVDITNDVMTAFDAEK